MNIEAYDLEKIELVLTDHEFGVAHQCLNEICNGFVVPDFQHRIGADIDTVRALMHEMAEAYYAGRPSTTNQPAKSSARTDRK